jgi:hypothetical protein
MKNASLQGWRSNLDLRFLHVSLVDKVADLSMCSSGQTSSLWYSEKSYEHPTRERMTRYLHAALGFLQQNKQYLSVLAKEIILFFWYECYEHHNVLF